MNSIQTLLSKTNMAIRTRLSSLNAVLVAVLATCFSGCKPSGQGDKVTKFDTATFALWEQSIAGIENKESDWKKTKGETVKASVDGFRKLAKQYPKDANIHQNLAVALLIQCDKATKDGDMTTLERLEKELLPTLAKLKELSPDASDPWVLEARLHLIKDNRDKAIELLRAAIKRPKAGADAHFQLVDQLLPNEQDADDPEMRVSLEAALKLSPNNLALAANYLYVLARLHDKKFVEEVDRCTKLFQPLINPSSRDVPKYLGLARQAGEKGEWDAALIQARRVRNLMIVEIAYMNDLFVLLKDDELDYLKLEFDNKISIPTSTRSPSSMQFQSISLPSSSGSVAAIAYEDLDLDGMFDLVLSVESRIVVWSMRDPEPKIMMEVPHESPVSGFVLFDVDRDFQRNREQLPESALPTTIRPDETKRSPDDFVDTDVDLIVYGPTGLALFENWVEKETGQRQLKSRPLSEGMESIKSVRQVATIDFDHDSDLDLVVSSDKGITLWSNRGDWTFAEVTSYSTLPGADQVITSILALDLDRNVLNDFLFGTEDSKSPIMATSNLHGRYALHDVTWPNELVDSCRSLEVIDANRDACWDVIGAGKSGTTLVTMNSKSRKTWVPSTAKRLSQKPALGLLVADFDNDSFPDCASWGPQGIEIFLGGSDGQLVLTDGLLKNSESIKQLIPIDFDHDRDIDLIGLNEQGNLLYWKNEGGNKNQQLELVIRADEDGKQNPRARCNMHGIGSLVEIKSKGNYQTQIVRHTRTYLGLGPQQTADIARVIWPNGIPNNLFQVSTRATVYDQQDLGGSCPYLYAWNGTRFEFCTDCLWAAPIGLQFAAGVSAPTREWEYLKIDGANLQPKDGEYILQLTEELWEAAYFDAIQLMAIDHSPEIDVFTNEKVGPAEIAQFKLYTVRNRRLPNSIKDQNGNDLLDLVSKRDQRFTKTWTEGYNQGLTETHWMEIDLNHPSTASEEPHDDDVVLYLTGWLFPTCTSLNLAMDQNPLRPKLHPPSIQVPDANGNWVETVPYSGFPGGKTKTIAIDLKGKFLCDDHRIRLVSNMELCWDEVFWTLGEREAETSELRVTPLTLTGADLHYRGFSKLIPQPARAPKRYEYDSVVTESIWPPMTGAFTRFGDVKELLLEPDDLQVVMGAGDEMTVRFSAPSNPLPPGWVRDFVIYNVGWDKDADLNTILGQDTAPLPFRAMQRYPYEPDQQFPNTPRHQDFLNRYQTRQQDAPAFWNQIRDFQ